MSVCASRVGVAMVTDCVCNPGNGMIDVTCVTQTLLMIVQYIKGEKRDMALSVCLLAKSNLSVR